VVVTTQAEEVLQAGAASVGPVADVVQVDAAGFAAGEPAAAVVAVVQEPAECGGAADHLGGADADRGSVLDVAAGRVGGMTGWRDDRRRFRGNAGWDRAW
jgi:hypothetical protein